MNNPMVSENQWQDVRRSYERGMIEKAQASYVVTLKETDAYTLPATTRKIRVLWGDAWVSHKHQDAVLRQGETLQFTDGIAIVTALGRHRVGLEVFI